MARSCVQSETLRVSRVLSLEALKSCMPVFAEGRFPRGLQSQLGATLLLVSMLTNLVVATKQAGEVDGRIEVVVQRVAGDGCCTAVHACQRAERWQAAGRCRLGRGRGSPAERKAFSVQSQSTYIGGVVWSPVNSRALTDPRTHTRPSPALLRQAGRPGHCTTSKLPSLQHTSAGDTCTCITAAHKE